MSNNVDGSISLGIVLEDSNVDEQARKIGEKIQKQLEKALQNSDFFKAIPTPKFEKGAGSREGKVYGDEFLNSFGKVLQSGNVQLAKSYQGTFNRILATEGETAAKSFIQNFEKILTTQGDKAASTFSNGLQVALKAGGSASAKQFADNFQKQFSAVAPNMFKDFNKAFNDVLNKSNPGTAKLFADVYQEANKSSTKAGEAFLQNFQKILSGNGSKAANEFAKGYQVAFRNQGEISANFYAESFKRRLEREKFEVKASIKTVPVGDFNNVLNSSNSSTAKGFANVYKDIAGSSEKAANEFSRAFQAVLKGTSPQIANEFAKGFQVAFKEGGSSSASTYAQSFKQRLENELKQQQFSTKTVIQPSPGVSNSAFGKVLGNSDVGTAKLFASTFKEVNQVSAASAEAFSKNFQRILSANGPKTAKEFASGFQASFKQGGTESAASFAQNFNNRLVAKSREAAREAAAAIKGEISAPEIPQQFVNAFSRILRKYGPQTAKEFSSGWSKVYETVGLDAANMFQKKFQEVLKRGGSKRASEYTRGITLAYSVAGEEAAKEFSKKFKNRAGIDIKGVASFMRDTLVSSLGNGLSGAVLGIFNGIFSTIKSGFDSLIGGFTGSIGRFMTVQKGLTNLKAVTGASDSEMGNIKGAIRSSALKSPTSTDDYTKISLELSKAGTPIDQINEKLLTSISLMSRLSGEGASETAGMVSQIQSSFSLPLEDMVSTMDLMTAVANGSQASIGSLANALSYTGATATAMGLSLEETARYLGILANNGLDASRGGTALTNMMADMAKNADLLKDLGVEIFDDKGAQNFEIALGSLQEKLKDLSAKDKYKFLSEIFGERGIRGVQALLTGLEEGDQKTAQLDKSIQAMNGSLSEAGGKLTDPASKFDILLNKVDVLRTEFGAAFEPGLNALIEFGDQTVSYLLENTDLFNLLNQANQEFADYLAEHPEYAQMLAEIIEELAFELFQELLNGTRSLLEYLKENPKAVQELFDGFKNFTSAVIDIIPKVGKLVELLYNGAKFLGLINDGANENSNGGDDGGNWNSSFKSGLFTGPESNNGGSSAYHIDSKFAKTLPFDKVVAAMDTMAAAYEEQGRVIEFSNSAVGGQRYDRNDPNRGDMIKKAFNAHSHSVHAEWDSLDYYIPKKDKDRFAPGSDGGEGVEIMLPGMGGEVGYGSGGGYGNYAFLADENGQIVMKTGHGDDRKPLPATKKSFKNDNPVSDDDLNRDNIGLMTGKKSTSSNLASSRGIAIKDESGNVSYATSGSSGRSSSAELAKAVAIATRTGQRDDQGLEKILVKVFDQNGKAVFQKFANSGDPSKQNKFAGQGQSKAEVREPLEYGDYKIKPTIASGLSGVGSKFTPIEPKFATDRTALGIHYDQDRSFKPGSAGCLVFKTEAEFNEFLAALSKSGVTDFEFRDGSKETGKIKNSKNSGGSKAAPKPTIQNANPDQLAGAVMAILEAPTRQGRIDAAQVISNRVGSNFDGFGRTIKDQVFAGDMRNPQFAPMRDFNIGKNDIKDFPSAVKTLMKKPGYSESLAKKELAEFFSDLSNPRMTQDSQNKVGGRHYFKGVSEQYAMVRGEDFLRNPNENFYHHENIDTKHRSVTPIGKVFGGGLGGGKAGTKSKMPEYETLNLMGDNSVDEFLNLSSSGSKLEKMREDKNKAIQKLLDEQEKIEKKQAAEEKKNDEESLKVKRSIFKERRDLEKQQLESNIQKNAIQFENTPLADSYKTNSEKLKIGFDFDTEITDSKLVIEDIDRLLKDIAENRGDEVGIEKTISAYEEQKKAVEENIVAMEKLKQQEISNVGASSEAKLLLDKRKQAEEELLKSIERKIKAQELAQKRSIADVQDGDIKSVLENTFKLGSLDLEKNLKVSPISNEIKLLEENIKLAKDSGLDFGTSLELMESKLTSLKADLEAINSEFKITGDTIQEESERILKAKFKQFDEEAFSSSSNLLKNQGNTTLDDELNKRKAIRQEEERFIQVQKDIFYLKEANPERFQQLSGLNRTINIANTGAINEPNGTGYDEKLKQTKIDSLKQRGDSYGAADVEQYEATIREMTRFDQEMQKLASLKGTLPNEEFERMVSSAKEISVLNLENISRSFDTLGNTIRNTAMSSISSFAMNAVKDFENIGDHFSSLIDTMISKLLEFVIQKAIFGMFGGGGGLLGGLLGGGGGSTAGLEGVTLDSPVIPGFATGSGILGGGATIGVDSFLAKLAPGEMVMSAEKVNQLNNISVPNISPGATPNLSSAMNNSVTTIVNIDSNGNASVERNGQGEEMARMIEQSVYSIVTGMKFNPGGMLNE